MTSLLRLGEGERDRLGHPRSHRARALEGAATITRPAPTRAAARRSAPARRSSRRDPATTARTPAARLCESGARDGNAARRPRAPSATRAHRRVRGKPTSATRTSPASSAPGSSTTPTFGAPNVTVSSATDRGPEHGPGPPSTPDGMSTATTGRAAPQARRWRRPTRPPGSPGTRSRRPRRRPTSARASSAAEPRAENPRSLRSPRPPGARSSPRARAARPGSTACTVTRIPAPGQVPRGDVSVAAVVALAAHDHGPPAVRPSAEVEHRPRDGPPGAFHQDPAGRRSPGRAIQLDRLLGVRTAFTGRTATAKATAFVFSCVNVISTCEIAERVRARLGTTLEPDGRRAARLPDDADVPPSLAGVPAERLDRGLARGEAPGVALGRTRLAVAVRDLLRREHPLAHRRMTGEGPLHPRDLADVDAEADDLHGRQATERAAGRGADERRRNASVGRLTLRAAGPTIAQ